MDAEGYKKMSEIFDQIYEGGQTNAQWKQFEAALTENGYTVEEWDEWLEEVAQ